LILLAGASPLLQVGLCYLAPVGFVDPAAKGLVRMFEKQAIESDGNEGQLPLDML